jgi:hypothetical protein
MQTQVQTVTVGERVDRLARLRGRAAVPRRAAHTARLTSRPNDDSIAWPAFRARPGPAIACARQRSLVAGAPHPDPGGGRMQG